VVQPGSGVSPDGSGAPPEQATPVAPIPRDATLAEPPLLVIRGVVRSVHLEDHAEVRQERAPEAITSDLAHPDASRRRASRTGSILPISTREVRGRLRVHRLALR
jgi:hypothetical protein